MSEGEVQQQQQTTIDGFELKGQIADGNASQIWEVTAPGMTTSLAMKLLLPEPANDSAELATLRHEFKVGSSLDHPNCIRFHTVMAKKGNAYIIMDYFRSANLKTQIAKELVGLQGRIRKLVEGICQSLGYMHEKGWVHRDIKPDNILMSKSSELRLIDFSLSSKAVSGLSKLFGGKLKTIQGTRTYIAPETIRKQQPTFQTDMYSLGVTLYEILTGQPPFTGTSPNDLLKKHLAAKPVPPSASNPNVSAGMDQFIAHLLAKKPTDRPKDMNEVFVEFRSVKPFKEDVAELEAQRIAEEKRSVEAGDSIASALDSRRDADRKVKTITKGGAGQGSAKPDPPKAPAQPAAQPQPVAQQPAGQPMMQPGMGMQPMPGSMQPTPGHPMQQPMMQPMPMQPMQQPMMHPHSQPMHPQPMQGQVPMAAPQQPMAPQQQPMAPTQQPVVVSQQPTVAPQQTTVPQQSTVAPNPEQPVAPTQQPVAVSQQPAAAAPQQPAMAAGSQPEPTTPTSQPVAAGSVAAPASNPPTTAPTASPSPPADPNPEADADEDEIPLMTELPDIM
ncbi:MAG: protein kinase [Planctomycetota bacterium]|nr:protein kinase [Planctomycetota bacterium]